MTDYKKYILSTGTHYISNSGSDGREQLVRQRRSDRDGDDT